MKKLTAILAMIVIANVLLAQVRTASEDYVTNRVHKLRAELIDTNTATRTAIETEALLRTAGDEANSNHVAAAVAAVIVEFSAGYVVSNWWSPVLTASYRSVSPPDYETTNSYLVSSIRTAKEGFIDWDLSVDSVAGFPGEIAWSVDDTTTVQVVGDKIVSLRAGMVRLTGDSIDVRRTQRVPINYSIIGQPVITLDRLAEGSAAYLASTPIIYMATNYVATTGEPLLPRPNNWNTNEMYRANCLAVIKTPSSVEWNPDCWLTNAAKVFCSTAIATGATPQASPAWHGTLIAPRIIIGARHAGLNVGQTKWWLTPDGSLTNAVVTRLITLNTRQTVAPLGYGGIPIAEPDIVMGYLSAPMPQSMVAHVASSAQLRSAFGIDYGAGNYVQGVTFDQHLGASLLEFSDFEASSVSIRKPMLPQSLSALELFHAAHPGDSGRPIFILWGDKAVLLATFYYAHMGSSIPYFIDKIAAACVREGQALTYIDFTEAP